MKNILLIIFVAIFICNCQQKSQRNSEPENSVNEKELNESINEANPFQQHSEESETEEIKNEIENEQPLSNQELIETEFYKRKHKLYQYEQKLLNQKKYKDLDFAESLRLNIHAPWYEYNMVSEKKIIYELEKNNFEPIEVGVGDIIISKTHSIVSVHIVREKFPIGFGIGDAEIKIVLMDSAECLIELDLILNYVLDKSSNSWLLFIGEYSSGKFKKYPCE